MSEEQKMILGMLSEGKITVEEAQRLLENLGSQPPREETRRDSTEPPRSIVENIVETLRSGLSNINFDFSDYSRIVLEENHSGSFSSREVELVLDVRNGSVRVEPSEDTDFHLEVIKRVKAGTREQAERMVSGYKFAEHDGRRLKAGDTECRDLRNRVSVSLRLRLPAGHVYTGSITSKNGAVEVNGIDVENIKFSTVNGGIKAAGVTGQRMLAGTVNGSVNLEGCLEQVEAWTTNGSINLLDMAEDSKISLKTVNGRIQVRLPSRNDIAFHLDARARAGNVRVEHEGLSGQFSTQRQGAGRVIHGSTPNWENARHKISMYLSTVNGSIGIQDME